MSSAILQQRQNYYRILEQSQKGNLDISEWATMVLRPLEPSVNQSLQKIRKNLIKARSFGNILPKPHVASRLQRKYLRRLLDGGEMALSRALVPPNIKSCTKASPAQTATSRHLT